MARGNVQPQLEQCADSVAGEGMLLAMILADRQIKPLELVKLAQMALRLCGYSVQMDDIVCDYRLMDQIWRLSRHSAPNDKLETRIRNVARLMADFDPAVLEAPAEELVADSTVDDVLGWLLAPLIGQKEASLGLAACEASRAA